MKKSLSVLSLSLLALAVLAGCGNTGTSSSAENSQSDSVASSQSDVAPTVAVAAGKTGFIVKIVFDGVTCPSYVSVWMTGCMSQVKGEDQKITSTWKTGLDAIEMDPVSGHDGWYFGESDVYTKTDYEANLGTGVTNQSGEYALVLGYNSTADISDAKKGLQWVNAYKSTYCASFSFPNNAKFDAEGGDKALVTLTADTFTAVPKKPEAPLTNYTLKVEFSVGLPAYEIPHLLGSFDGWITAWSAEAEVAHRMATADPARKMWTFNFASIIPDTYDIGISLDYTIEAKSDTSAYSWTKPDDWKDNHKYTVNAADGNDYVMANEDALSADLTIVGVMADPNALFDYIFQLTNTGTTLTDDVYLSGGITAWAQTEATKMTVDATGLIYTFQVSQHAAGAVNFRFLVGASWDHCIGSLEDTGDHNFAYQLPSASGTIAISVDLTNVLTANVIVSNTNAFTFTPVA